MKILSILILCFVFIACSKAPDTNEETPLVEVEQNSQEKENVEPEEKEYTKEDLLEQQREKSEGLDFLGLTEEEALNLANENNVSFRVVKRDGRYLAVTMDYRPGRINAEIEDGKVTTFNVE